jgi:hypothetical protein
VKHAAPEGQQPLSMGAITKDGFVDTGPSTWFGRAVIGRSYYEALAGAIGGQIKASNYQTQEAGIRTATGKMARLSEILPQHEQVWLDAMARYISQTCDQAGSGVGSAGDGEPGAADKQSDEKLRKLAHERI